MDKKIKITTCVIIVAILIVIIFNIVKQKDSKVQEKIENQIEMQIKYNNETGKYYIEDETGTITHEAETEDELYIYIIDPDYDAKNPSKSNEFQ